MLRGAAVEYDLPVAGPHDTFKEARPPTAFPDAEAVAPAGTCTTVQACVNHWRDQCSLLVTATSDAPMGDPSSHAVEAVLPTLHSMQV